jgi:hypothetical protein
MNGRCNVLLVGCVHAGCGITGRGLHEAGGITG